MEGITVLPTNTVVCNSDFEIGLSEWTQSPNGGEIDAIVESSEVQNGASSVKVTASNTESGQPILSSCKSDVEEGKKYEISFWMKSDLGGETVVATSSLSASPYTNYGQTSITLTNSWTEYSFITEADTTVYSNVRLAKFKFLNDGVYYVDNITIDGTEIDLSSGDLTLDVAGDIILDADGGDVFFKDGGTTFGSATNTSGNLIIKSGTTTALTFSGANVTAAGNLTVDGNLDVTGTLDLSDSNFTNVGSLQLDSIAGDGDTDTSITFSGWLRVI